jgi:hypothetical protein
VASRNVGRGRNRKSRQLGQRFDPCAGHDCSAVIFHCSLTDAQIGGDILVRMPGQYTIHDLALTLCQCCDLAGRDMPNGNKLAAVAGEFYGTRDRCKKIGAADRFLDKI